MQSFKARLKNSLDARLPGFARYYRQKRDERRLGRHKPILTEFGFTLIGDDGIASSRTASNETATVQQAIAAADVFVDVGANVGFFTCLAAKAGRNVLAIEPHPLNLRCLYENLRSNNLVAEVFPIAIGAYPGVQDLFGGGQGASLVQGWGGIQATYATPTAVNTLDNIVVGRFAGQRIAVKIDTEGNELGVLQGAAAMLDLAPRPVWLIEIGLTENFAGRINPHFRQIFDIFWSRGYSASSVEARRPVTGADVERWVAAGRRDFGDGNFMFA